MLVSSPMLMTAAATQMSHTTCFMALAWMTWCWLRTTDDDAPLSASAGLALFFCLAFWIRPSVALTLGAPLLLHFAFLARPAASAAMPGQADT